MKLKVKYDSINVSPDMDKAIEKALLPFGLEMYGSGYNLITGVRDLAFDDKEDDKVTP